jgi:hypothetical protein
MRLRPVLSVLSALALLPAAARALCPAPRACQIVLYSGVDYTGDCQVLNAGSLAHPGVYDHPALEEGVGNDATQSIRVGPGTVVELWEHFTPYGGGTSFGRHSTFHDDDPDLNDDVIAGVVSSAALICPPDVDGDGLPNAQDPCPASDRRATVDIAGCDSGVSNPLFPTSCTIADLVGECGRMAISHAKFVNCVSILTSNLQQAGVLTTVQKGAIQTCAGQADVP